MAAKGRRKLTITSFDEKSSGTSKGRKWTLYEVACVDEAGEPVDAKLKTFADAPKLVGKLVEFEVERQEDERYGVSYMLSVPRAGGGGLKDSVDDLRARVERLEHQVAELARDGRRDPAPSSGRESPVAPDVPPGAEGPAGHGTTREEYQF
jgi:hypothetical protein